MFHSGDLERSRKQGVDHKLTPEEDKLTNPWAKEGLLKREAGRSRAG